MWKEGIVPNEVTFAGIIDAYGRMGDTENMLRYFNMMEKYGVKADTPIYGAMINGFGKKGEFDQMLKYFELMKAAGSYR
jgi:leucine-rich PPR motif-containing protein